ncbi:MAG: homoserine dehydrogenase [Anaerolineae bacterium]|nr:homoserine dehydrogenase [Anaerolineae bacterium]MDW8171685.1 homoserine dehydrogenase [Anaerolineae bacterium]
MRLFLIGFGTVGQSLAELLLQRAEDLRTRHNFVPALVGVYTRSQGLLYAPEGLDLAQLRACAANYALYDGPRLHDSQPNIDRALRDYAYDVLIEASTTDLRTGQPAADRIERALTSGKHVVTVNKGPIALYYPRLRDLAREKGVHLRYEGTVMAGTPSIALALEGLAAAHIRGLRGILNGTTNYMLTQMEQESLSYDQALAQAQALGYAEADPTADVDGWDAAGKASILSAALFGAPRAPQTMSVSGIGHLTLDDLAQARAQDKRYKLVVRLTPEAGQVRAEALPLSDPLASVMGALNAITLETDLLGEVTLIGSGAGGLSTATAILNDLLAIHRAT